MTSLALYTVLAMNPSEMLSPTNCNSEKGWGPLTFNLFNHPELKKEKTNNAVSGAYNRCSLQGIRPLALEDLNITDGLTGTLLDKMIDQKCHERVRNEAPQQQTNDLLEWSKEQFTTAV